MLSTTALQSCAFFAIDCEMTGLFVDGVREEFLDDVQDRWGRIAADAQHVM
jgi:poly(A)-specific ribonuclease